MTRKRHAIRSAAALVALFLAACSDADTASNAAAATAPATTPPVEVSRPAGEERIVFDADLRYVEEESAKHWRKGGGERAAIGSQGAEGAARESDRQTIADAG